MSATPANNNPDTQKLSFEDIKFGSKTHTVEVELNTIPSSSTTYGDWTGIKDKVKSNEKAIREEANNLLKENSNLKRNVAIGSIIGGVIGFFIFGLGAIPGTALGAAAAAYLSGATTARFQDELYIKTLSQLDKKYSSSCIETAFKALINNLPHFKEMTVPSRPECLTFTSGIEPTLLETKNLFNGKLEVSNPKSHTSVEGNTATTTILFTTTYEGNKEHHACSFTHQENETIDYKKAMETAVIKRLFQQGHVLPEHPLKISQEKKKSSLASSFLIWEIT